MKIDVDLEGRKCTLTPYLRCHVPQYHKWMQSEFLQEMTASEPLSLAEEYDMQVTWMDDPLKLTFIVLDTSDDSSPCMCGDVNIFFHKYLQDVEHPRYHEYQVGEVEVMIAEPLSRRKGIAQEALRLIMEYATVNLRTEKFLAKVSYSNVPSQQLFTTKMGFTQIDADNTFEEFTYELRVPTTESDTTTKEDVAVVIK